ncbi:hypothetical protein AURDEDRAFT_128015 [Auricularia subglabra TFB-10046 SS5]|nr:hypothetical protein AURDEDRAFT_128015 [Auricularia subglabra TFB-10046 SS5]
MRSPQLCLDVLFVIFNHLDYHSLLALSHVSGAWRTAARRHPKFWKELSIDDRGGLTFGGACLFADRLDAICVPTASIKLALRLSASSKPLTRVIIPALRRHIHRAEEIAFELFPPVARVLWPLFLLDAPILRDLQVILHVPRPDVPPLPGLFNAHNFVSLERVFLMNVPFAHGNLPVTHVLKAIKAIYLRTDSSVFHHITSWLPRSEAIDFWSSENSLPSLTNIDFLSLRQFVVYHDAQIVHLQRLCSSLHAIIFSPGSFRLSRIRTMFPSVGPICVRVEQTGAHPAARRWSKAHITVASPCGGVVRHFEGVPMYYIASQRFIADFFPTNRLTILAIPLQPCFMELAQRQCRLMQLTTLRLFLDCLPETHRTSLLCPRLSTLILQPEVAPQYASFVQNIFVSSLVSFVKEALAMEHPGLLQVVLNGLVLIEDALPWDLAPINVLPLVFIPRTSQRGTINRLPSAFRKFEVDWIYR